MSPRPLVIVLLLASAKGLQAQACSEKHYRWSEKVDATMASQSPTSADVSDVLSWSPRKLTQKDKCAPRAGHELDAYTVTGWVRRIKLHEADGDWHIEITEVEDSPVPANCIIVEIPDSSVFHAARESLSALVDTTQLTKAGDLTTAVQVTFTGAAFFDGYHQHLVNGKAKASQHGRCNSRISALWELHPVFAVSAPE